MKIKSILGEGSTPTTTPIFRGMRTTEDWQVGDIITFNIRSDRKPVNSTILTTVLFDYGIEKQFNIPSVRRSASFGTTEKLLARDYAGNHPPGVLVELVLPPDATLLYNPRVADSFDITELGPARSKISALFRSEGAKYMKRHNDSRGVDSFVRFFTSGFLTPHLYLTHTSEELIDQIAQDIYHDDRHGEGAAHVAERLKSIAMAMTRGYTTTKASQFNVKGHVEVLVYGLTSAQGKVVETFG